MKAKFVIYSPSQHYSGGALVLHVLCHKLVERGYDARIFDTYQLHPVGYSAMRCAAMHVWHRLKTIIRLFIGRFTPSLMGKRLIFPIKPDFFPFKKYRCPIIIDQKNTIVIYPEMVWGNPMMAQHVVRYMLYFGRSEYTSSFSEEDLKINYQQKFATEGVSIGAPVVCLTYINQTYKRTHFGKRKGRCYIIRKGRDFVKQELLKPGTIVDDLSDEEICRIFNECKYCISFDQYTYFTSYAIKCGCIPIVVPRPGQTKEDWRPLPRSRWGHAFGFTLSEIKYAIRTAPQKQDDMKENINRNEQAIDTFIEACQKHFKQLCLP